jgi:hypothetical protein
LNEDSKNIASKTYDLNSIGTLIDKKKGVSICDYDDKELIKIKGGLEYKRIECLVEKQVGILKKKIPEYFDLTLDDFKVLNAMHKRINKDTTIEEIIDILIKQRHLK